MHEAKEKKNIVGYKTKSTTNTENTEYVERKKCAERKERIQEYEEIAMNAFPAKHTEVYDGWILRYTDGYTYRGNSVNPMYSSVYSLEEKVIECEKRFHMQGLPCVYKMTPVVEEGLDSLLERYGYDIQKQVYIMNMDLAMVSLEEEDREVNNKEQDTVEEIEIDKDKENEKRIEIATSNKMSDAWLEEFVVLNETSVEPTKSIAKDVLRRIINPVFCASIKKEGKVIACGLGVLERGKLGLYDIRVSEQERHQGFGTQICKQLLAEGKKAGAKEAYLQVSSTNDNAVALYKKLGFAQCYTYWYRVKEME
ncbi:GNAT family N-acetyltransferase [Anaerosporobacter faecicola]|uniref:GNAT family N-acetyltransferase n=1 Tax=Anaerosporobacter faecicola TaxID=2718714 RepID=UPI001438AC57|nr:GNAT family N-acetyltransferase [Anaerosporobacter faecicola]